MQKTRDNIRNLFDSEIYPYLISQMTIKSTNAYLRPCIEASEMCEESSLLHCCIITLYNWRSANNTEVSWKFRHLSFSTRI